MTVQTITKQNNRESTSNGQNKEILIYDDGTRHFHENHNNIFLIQRTIRFTIHTFLCSRQTNWKRTIFLRKKYFTFWQKTRNRKDLRRLNGRNSELLSSETAIHPLLLLFSRKQKTWCNALLQWFCKIIDPFFILLLQNPIA